MLIKTEVEVTPRRIADLMVTAIESGIGYWCKGVYLRSPRISTGHTGPWYDDENLYEVRAEELSIEVVELDPSSAEGSWIINLKSMEKAFMLMQSFGKPKGYCWRDFINENEDAITADVWFQLAVFGEVVYG